MCALVPFVSEINKQRRDVQSPWCTTDSYSLQNRDRPGWTTSHVSFASTYHSVSYHDGDGFHTGKDNERIHGGKETDAPWELLSLT